MADPRVGTDKAVAVVRASAASSLCSGTADLAIKRSGDLWNDCRGTPCVVLSPKNPLAARVVVELQLASLWMAYFGEYPGIELVGGDEEAPATLAPLITAVVQGRYLERASREARLGRRSWEAIFDTPEGRLVYRHNPGNTGEWQEREYAPY